MKKTILTTPIINSIFRFLARIAAKLCGWKLLDLESSVERGVLIGAPHTSNWDFLTMLLGVLVWRKDVRWIGKNSMFKGPFGPLMCWLGGISIDRSTSNHFVKQMIECFENNKELIVVIAPEGTRASVQKWRTGFYHMAFAAGVPIILAFADYEHKEVGVLSVEMPSGNIEEDIKRYQAFYSSVHPKHPDNYYDPHQDA